MDDIQNILNAMMRVAVDPQTAAVAIAVIGLNIHFGYTGLLNIGQSAFMLLGAYGFAISITQGWPLCVAIVVGLMVAFVFALVLGVPTLKLRGDYLAIVTISAAEIIRYVGRSVGYERLFNLTGGAQGIPGSQYRGPFTGPLAVRQRQHDDPQVQLHRRGRRLDRGPAGRVGGGDRPDLDGGADRARQDVARGHGPSGRHDRHQRAHDPRRVLPRPGHPAEHRRRRLVVHLRRLDPRRDQPADRARPHPEPMGTCPARRPRGRGRDAQPRQERVRDQDAGADHRRPVRRDRRHDVRPARHRAAGLAGPLDHVLLLHRAAARWRGHASGDRCSGR